ncbi:MAG TPA: LytTR family DNA-binding domain-containing protein [Chitinophagaceae bacterium]|mgnify:CR=1 FL=1|nr:LytTR family DNA-binding domain-containing protein [Chitinophagaceae bacterium]
MLNACIIDDEVNSREVLELMLKENHPDINIVATASTISEGLEKIYTHHPDIIFLDIEMPGGSGFDLVKQLKEPLPEIIFCTAYGHYAIKAIECSALAYLLKPVSSQKLHEALAKAKMKSSQLQRSLQMNVLEEQLNKTKEPSRFLLNTVEDIKVIKIDDVICCIAESNYTRIHLTDGTKLVASKTLKEFENILSRPNFFRIHHSYLINLNYIQRINKSDGCIVEMPHNICLDVAKNKKDELLLKITSL